MKTTRATTMRPPKSAGSSNETTSREFPSSSRSLEKRIRAQKKRRSHRLLLLLHEDAQKVESNQCAFASSLATRTKHRKGNPTLLVAALLVVVAVVFLAQDFPLQSKLSIVHCASNQNTNRTSNSTSTSTSPPPKKSVGKQVKPATNQKQQQLANSTRTKAKAVASARNDVRRNPQLQDSGPEYTEEQLQISITPRVSLIRVPVDSNAMLKCLISANSVAAAAAATTSSSKLNQKFDVHWSRFMYDEHVYEQLDTSPLLLMRPAPSQGSARSRRWTSSQSEDVLTGKVPFNRQEQLRDFLARSRQETNVISDLLIEATLSISPVKASDNASYYCTAFDSKPSSSSSSSSAYSGAFDQNQARIDLIALSRPVVQLERVSPSRDSKSAQIHWLVLSDGNTPITKTILMVRNDTTGESFSSRPLPPELAGATATAAVDYYETTTQSQYSSMVIDSDLHQWQKIEIPQEDDSLPSSSDVDASAGSLMSPYDHPSSANMASADVDVTSPLGATSSNTNVQQQQQDYYMSRLRWNLLRSNKRRRRSYNLTSLLPGVTYNFRLAAINDMGQSEWSYLAATMPNEIPAQISEMFLLSRTNDTLVIGWRRPAYDTSKTVRYEMQLFDLNRTLTLDANTNTSSATSAKTNFMYIFVNLNAGTDYHFHVRACSRAGCSAYSSPKLLASTLDGEPDEPLEVELSCEYDHPSPLGPGPGPGSGSGSGGNVSVSWLPPANPRGQLLNYSVAFESRARYRNQSGQWQVDEWRSNMETVDNQTLSLDATGILLPNTNYSVRVCANNRSKHCGRLSQLTSRSQCSTPPELPSELPPGIRLKRHSRAATSGGESLQLELPHISARNGTLSCVQIILIRLPASFADGTNLGEFLPERADSVTLSRYSTAAAGESLQQRKQQQQTPEQAHAYLAEEIDPESSSAAQQVARQVTLGDGRHEQCRMRGPAESIARPEVFDGPLRARTYYTGFVKLILIRSNRLRSKYSSTEMKRSTAEETQQQQEILTKYSGYFEPVQLGEHVLELSATGLSDEDDGLDVIGGDGSASAKLRPLQEMATELGDNLRRNLNKFYNFTSSYVGENLRLERLADFIRKSSPLMQLLEVGVIVIVISLLLLFLVYLLTLPATIGRRRKRRIKRQLNKHQQAAQQASLMSSQQESQLMEKTEFPQMPLPATDASEYIAQQQGQLSPPTDLQQAQTMYGTPRECPIHSSPATSNNSQQQQQVIHRQPPVGHEHRQAAVHVCQPMMVYGNSNTIGRRQSSGVAEQQTYHYHQHQYPVDAEQYERNCRTTRRNQADLQALSAKNCLTLSHQQQLNSSVMALAKKINKSIPLRLFRAVLECRLRNGWLKDEYEQLPNPLLAAASELNQKVAPQETILKLRPQLIVSRNDSMSALISGNDQYDAGLLVTPPTGNQQQQKRIICARSPLDADSVWDFWRLVYEQDVSTIVMLTQNEDSNTGELRCAQYWPTCDNEETTILSPCNEYVQKSQIRPAKFKIRQETLDGDRTAADGFMVRRLTLIVMATKAGENGEEDDTSVEAAGEAEKKIDEDADAKEADNEDDDEEKYVIVERDILQLQFHCWNTSTPANQLRLITFIRRANERHLMNLKQQQATDQISPQRNANNPMLVHCYNGLGRSGVFAGLSFLLDELVMKLRLERQQQQQQQQVLQKVNLFQLVGRMRLQREMIISPYRFYELLYQLTANCVPHDMAATLH